MNGIVLYKKVVGSGDQNRGFGYAVALYSIGELPQL